MNLVRNEPKRQDRSPNNRTHTQPPITFDLIDGIAVLPPDAVSPDEAEHCPNSKTTDQVQYNHEPDPVSPDEAGHRPNSKTMDHIQYKNVMSIPGHGPMSGAVLWTETAEDGTLKTGHGVLVTDLNWNPQNLLMLSPNAPSIREESFLPGRSLFKNVVKFGPNPASRPNSTLILTIGWMVALQFWRRLGFVAIACLFYENVANVVQHLLADMPRLKIFICFNGHGGESGNPQLQCLYELSRIKGVTLIPSGDGTTFEQIALDEGRNGLLKKIDSYDPDSWTPVGKTPKIQSPWDQRRRFGNLTAPPAAVPWSAPINGRYMLENLMATIRKYVALSNEALLLVALWVIFTYVPRLFRFAPILNISSPENGCGKTQLNHVLELMCRMCFQTKLISMNVLNELIDDHHPTLILDEAKTMLRNADFVATLVGSFDQLDHEHPVRASVKVTRSLERSVFALACVKAKLPDELLTRSVLILMQQRAPNEKVEDLGSLQKEAGRIEFMSIKAQIEGWTRDNAAQLKAATHPDLCVQSSRANDTMGPLLIIANAIGPKYGEKAIEAALSVLELPESARHSRALLGNIREVVTGLECDVISSTALLEQLCANNDWPWADLGLNSIKLAKILAPYGHKTKSQRMGGSVVKGYDLAPFKATFDRYLPPQSPGEHQQ